ncbi:MAG: hypothetical protein R2865_16775 [Deinococcales bacterium]
MNNEVNSDAEQKLYFQDYKPQALLADVKHIIKKHRALEGWFMEHLRLSEGKVEGLDKPFELRQLSLSKPRPTGSTPFTFTPNARKMSCGV